MIGVGAGVLVDEVTGQHPIHQQREFARGGRNRLRFADTNGQAAIEGAERGGGARKAHGTAAQHGGRAIGRRRGPGAEQSAARDFVVGRQGKPGGEMLGGAPAVHVSADLGDQLERGLRADGVNLAQVGAAGEPV